MFKHLFPSLTVDSMTIEQSLPCNVVMTDIKEDEEAVIVGCVGLVGSQHSAHFFKSNKVNDVNVDLLRNGRRV